VVPSVHTILTVPFSYWFIANVITSYSCGIIADGFEAGGTGLAWYGNPANPAGGFTFVETYWVAYGCVGREFTFSTVTLKLVILFMTLLQKLGVGFIYALRAHVTAQEQTLAILIVYLNSLSAITDAATINTLREAAAFSTDVTQ
jgi:hypothetical protein